MKTRTKRWSWSSTAGWISVDNLWVWMKHDEMLMKHEGFHDEYDEMLMEHDEMPIKHNET